MDPTAEKHYTTPRSLAPLRFSSRRKYSHSKRGSRKPTRPTPIVSYYAKIFCPHQKCAKNGSVGTTPGLIANGRGFESLQSRADGPPTRPTPDEEGQDNSPHPKRGTQKPIRPTSKNTYYYRVDSAHSKDSQKMVESAHPRQNDARSGVRAPAVRRWETRQTRPTQFILAPLQQNFPHQCTIQQSPEIGAGPVGSLPGAL